MEKNLEVIIKGSAIILLGTMYGHLLIFAFRVILARHFGNESFGELSIGISIVVILVQISSLGLTQGIPMFVSMMHEKGQYSDLLAILRFGMKVIIVSSVVSTLIIILASKNIAGIFNAGNEFPILLILFAIVIPFQVMFSFFTATLRGFKNMPAIVLCDDLVYKTSLVMFVLIVTLFELNIYLVPIVQIASFLLATLLAVVILKRYYSQYYKSSLGEEYHSVVDSGKIQIKLINHSIPLIFSSISGILRQRLDVLIIGFLLSPKYAGLYYAVIPIAMTMIMLRNVVNRILMPVLTEVSVGSGKYDEVYELYESTARIISLVIIPISAFLMCFSEEIIFALLGSEFVGATDVLTIVIPGLFIYVLSGNFGAILQSKGYTKHILYTSIYGTLLNLSLMYVLVNYIGIVGAAIAVSLSFSIMGLIGLYYVYILFNFHPFSVLLNKGLVFGITSFFIFYLSYTYFNFTSVSKFIVFAVTVLIYIYVVKEFQLIKKEESLIFNKSVKSIIKPLLSKLRRTGAYLK